MHLLAWFAVAAIAFAAMEGMAWLSHRYVMHGVGWAWHRSHHEPSSGTFERNDLFAVIGAGLSVALFLLAGRWQAAWLQAVAAGITLYGLVYAFVHDGLVHQRWPFRWHPRSRYVTRLVQAHRLHHAVRTREGAVSFGFLLVGNPRRLAAELRARRTAARTGGSRGA